MNHMGEMTGMRTFTNSSDTPKMNVTIGGDDRITLEYYIRKLWNADTPEMLHYQLHGNCYIWGVDASNWNDNTDPFCEMGLYYDATKIDWLLISLDYKGQAVKNTWSCTDGFSDGTTDFTYTKETSPAKNCMANDKKSNSAFQEGKAYLKGHWMREFKSMAMDKAQDIDLMPGQNITADVRVKYGNNQFVQQLNVKLNWM